MFNRKELMKKNCFEYAIDASKQHNNLTFRKFGNQHIAVKFSDGTLADKYLWEDKISFYQDENALIKKRNFYNKGEDISIEKIYEINRNKKHIIGD